MANKNYLGDGRVSQAGFDVVIRNSDVHRFVGEASLNEAFDKIHYKAVASDLVSTYSGIYLIDHTYYCVCQ